MRKIFTTLKSVIALAVIASMTLAASCSYDDSAITKRVEKIERDLAALTDRVNELENQAIEDILGEAAVVVSVETDADNNTIITLSNGKTIKVLAEANTLKYRVIDGVLEISADGVNWTAVTTAPECVVTEVVVNDNGTVTITLANGQVVTVNQAELIECEAARSEVYVIAGATKEIPFAINDAVADINIMNQPFGWSATVEALDATRAVGGENFVLKINGPAQELVNAGYAAKNGTVSVHFNTEAGACKVLSVNVTLAEVTMTLDSAGNITIVNTMATEQENYWGETFVDFADFFIGIMPKSLYDEHGVDALINDFQDWDYASAAVTQRSTGLWNVAELQNYEEGVYEKEVIEITVDRLAQAFYPTYSFEVGQEYIVFISLESEMKNYYQIPVLDNAIMATYRKVLVEAELVADSAKWNDATYHMSLAGYQYYLVGWLPVAEVEEYLSEGYYGSTVEEFLPTYISGYGLMSSGAIVADIIDEDVALSSLAERSLMEYAPEIKADTEYYFYVYPFNAANEMELYQHEFVAENLFIFENFKTKALAAGSFDATPEYELVLHNEQNIKINVTLPEGVTNAYYTWFDAPAGDAEEALALVMNDVYANDTTELSFSAEKYGHNGLPNPIYFALIAINEAGEYVYVEQEFKYIEPEPIALTSFDYLGRYYDLYDEDESTSGGDFIYKAVAADGQEFTIGLYYTYANADGSIIEGTYNYRGQYLDSMYSYWNGFVIESETYYDSASLIVTAEEITLKLNGQKYIFTKEAGGNTGGDEPVDGAIIADSAVLSGYDLEDCYIYLYFADSTKALKLNFYKIISDAKNFIPEGTYEFGGYAGAVYTGGYSKYFDYTAGTESEIYAGTVEVSVVDEKYHIVVNAQHGDTMENICVVYTGTIDGLILPTEYVAPEPETIQVAMSTAKFDGWYLYFYDAEGKYTVVLYPWEMIDSNKLYIPEGTYYFESSPGSIYPGYSVLYKDGGQTTFDYGGVMTVAEVNGAYHIEVYATLNNELINLEFSYDGLIEGLILPSEYAAQPEPEPEPEPEPISFAAVRADYDNKMELYEYNGGDAEYAFWLYDEANNYIEVICKFGPHTGWDYQYSAAKVIDGVRTEATEVQTQAPSEYNCEAGEKYFVVNATFADATTIQIANQLPAVEVNYLGEGSTYAPGSENQGGDEPSEPEVAPEFVIPGEGGTYTYDFRYTKLVDGLDATNAIRVAQDNGWIWDIKFNPGLSSIVPGDYTAVGGFTTADALEVDTYNSSVQYGDNYQFFYPDSFNEVSINVQQEGEFYCITLIGANGYSAEGKTYRLVYIGKIQ